MPGMDQIVTPQYIEEMHRRIQASIEEQKEKWTVAIASGLGVFSGAYQSGSMANPDEIIESAEMRMKMLAMRLRIGPSQRGPFQFLETCLTSNDEVIVFVVQNDEAITLKDERNLFPSDSLITQLRLLI